MTPSAPLAALVDRWTTTALPTLPGRTVIPTSVRAFTLAGLAARADAPLLAIVPGEHTARDLVDDLRLFTDRAVLLPAWETLPFEHVSPNLTTMAARSAARHRLATGGAGTVVVAAVRAVVQRVSPSPVAPIELTVGSSHPFEALLEALSDLGYTRTERVEHRAEMAVRGGIVDVFPATADHPVRIDFWGDEVESIRAFDIASQRSDEAVTTVTIAPAREVRLTDDLRAVAAGLRDTQPWAQSTWDLLAEGVTFAGYEAWLPWLNGARTVLHDHTGPTVVFDPVQTIARGRDLMAEERDLAEALAPTWGTGSPAPADMPALYLDLEAAMAGHPVLQAPSLPTSPDDPAIHLAPLRATPGEPEEVIGALARLRADRTQVVLAMDGEASADRVVRILGEEGFVLDRHRVIDGRDSGVIGIGIHEGFHLPELRVAVFGEQEITGRRHSHRRTSRTRRSDVTTAYRDLVPGDHVVHDRHGIARFEGLVTRTIAGVERDYLILAYAGEDKLYLPTDQLGAIQPYTGGEQPRLSRMGGADWDKTKHRVRKAVAAVAEEVVRLHRARAAAVGHAYPPDTPWQREMEGAFPFEETADQQAAIDAVKADMERAEPMDRLVFGDVGFGKTEVAIRAAFKAVTAGRQVVVLCPTTLLAQQHTQTFTERFAPYPIRVEMLSRFLTAKQQRAVIAGLASGDVDVVIGTHRLLSDEVTFKDLGLLIVDEEQRFGVAAKDRIKAASVAVDVLTLTATPIPRTLEMALTGVREVSHIRTAPGERHPILTAVGPFDEAAVSAAIRRELLREGQVFYVHNRVQTIERAVQRIRSLVPDARVAMAHGQMSEGQLEQVMVDFWNREYDVLVATTIIESGLDLPSVNTLIVERADLLGLGQLYQLRGRVGRSTLRAYAYLFHPPEQSLSETAYRRLQAIGEATELGSGFELARRDLEIRGAGSMLGEVQSGHIAAVGFDLYAQLVGEAVGELVGTEPPPPAAEIRIDLPVDAHLPEGYVPDQQARLEAYRRLATAVTVEEIADVAAEWLDRYGELPPEAEALLAIARLRAEAARVGLDEVMALRSEIRMGPVDFSAAQEVRFRRLTKRRGVLKSSEGVIFVPAPPKARLVDDLLAFMAEMWPDETGRENDGAV